MYKNRAKSSVFIVTAALQRGPADHSAADRLLSINSNKESEKTEP
jgi:hypothetical protein